MMRQVADDGKLNVSGNTICLVKELGGRERSQAFNNIKETMYMRKACRAMCSYSCSC